MSKYLATLLLLSGLAVVGQLGGGAPTAGRGGAVLAGHLIEPKKELRGGAGGGGRGVAGLHPILTNSGPTLRCAVSIFILSSKDVITDTCTSKD